MEMGEIIKNLRISNGLTQEELGEKLGIQKSAIRKYEKGEVENIKRTNIKKMADVFGVSPTFIMGWEKESSYYKIGDTIKKRREELGMSKLKMQQELGYIRPSTIDKIERGEKTIDSFDMLKIAEILQISPKKLMGWEDAPSDATDYFDYVLEKGIDIIEDANLKLLELSDDQYELYDQNRNFIIRLRESEIVRTFDYAYYKSTEDFVNTLIETADYAKESNDHRKPKPKPKGVKIPVRGEVAAGVPIEAVEDILDYEEITAELASTGDFFALQIRGDSMAPRMCTGDVVIVRQQPTIETGEIAVVLVNGDAATVKKIQKSEAGIMLIPSNHAYEPQFYSNAEIQTLPIQILGKVVELRAKF